MDDLEADRLLSELELDEVGGEDAVEMIEEDTMRRIVDYDTFDEIDDGLFEQRHHVRLVMRVVHGDAHDKGGVTTLWRDRNGIWDMKHLKGRISASSRGIRCVLEREEVFCLELNVDNSPHDDEYALVRGRILVTEGVRTLEDDVFVRIVARGWHHHALDIAVPHHVEESALTPCASVAHHPTTTLGRADEPLLARMTS